MKIFSDEDKNLIGAMRNNKIVVPLFPAWFILMKKNKHKAAEIIADFIITHDYRDIGDFDHLHHWLSGYVMKIISRVLAKKGSVVDKYIYFLEEMNKMYEDPEFIKHMKSVRKMKKVADNIRGDKNA